MPTAESSLDEETGEVPAAVSSFDDETGEMPAAASFDDETGEVPTAEVPVSEEASTVETPTIEEQLKTLEETGELPAIGDDEATKVAALDDQDEATRPGDATAEIELDDLGLDLENLAESGLVAALDETGEMLQPSSDELAATGSNEAFEETDASVETGKNPMVDTDVGSTGIQQALDATSEVEITDTEETGTSEVVADLDDTATGVGIDTSLLDATGQTQILSDDLAVETASDVDDLIGDDAETLLASLDDEDEGSTVLGDEDFDFAKTEALPKDVFTGMDPVEDTGELPGLAETDMDLDLDDLTAALRVSEVGDTVDQPRDDATVEQPRPGEDIDLDVGDTADEGGDVPTERLAPEDVSGELHDARTMTEVGTKLDLARAYVDMGDPGGARSILEEVLDEGDDSQRQQAQQLLDSLPG